MPNIKEISRLAGVSTATVSNVLNNSPKVTVETREKVLKVIKETQYQPNTIAKSLKVKRTNTIGVISEDITVFNTPEIINGIDEYSESCGFHIILNNLRLFKRLGNHYSGSAKYHKLIVETVQVLLSRQVDGIIYIGAHSRDVTGLIENISVPLVYTYCYSGDLHYSINYDDEEAAYKIIQYLIDAGHSKIGVISGRYDSFQSQARFKGCQRALLDYNLMFNPSYMQSGDWERQSGYELGKKLLELPDPPTAIFAMNDIMASGVVDAALEMKMAIPRELSLVGFDNRECSSFLTPPLTTMALPLNEMGKNAAEILIGLIAGDAMKPVSNHINIKCKLIERQSVAGVERGMKQ